MTSFVFHESLWHWSSPVWLVIIPAIVATLWSRSAVVWHTWFRVVALAVLLLAFVSPIGVLANGYLFSAHMIQHLLLLLVIPLFLLLSFPEEAVRAVMKRPVGKEVGRLLSIPMLGWCCGLGAMWFWHVPSLCSAATESSLVGLVRNISFLVAGLAFWWPIFAPVKSARIDPLMGIVYLFSACLGCTLLGIYITFTPITVCPAFANPADRVGILTALYKAGFTPDIDQQLGGLLMWVPPCSLYILVIISVMCRWYTQPVGSPESHASPSNEIAEPTS